MDREESLVYHEVYQQFRKNKFSTGYSNLAAIDAVRVLNSGKDHQTSVIVTVNKYNNSYD